MKYSNYVGYKNGRYWCKGCGEQYDPEGDEAWNTGGYCSTHCFFLRHVKPTYRGVCWSWVGTVNGHDTPTFQWPRSGPIMLASRYFEQAMNGPLPEDMVVGHWCGNRSCVNPWHLWRCTEKQHKRHESRRAANAKGRVYIEKLSPPSVWQIFNETGSWFGIAERYKTNYATVAWIKREYRSWMGRVTVDEPVDVERRYAMDAHLLGFLPKEKCIWVYLRERMVHRVEHGAKVDAAVAATR